eukprot:TRINITY_DN139_c1_g2_i2.p1 TRINITY_DN139_c1_g2~~TRINITY_DN139_c1_g2_i2.p1  ORF type:complete len:151 (+),score=14.17 TRINITY_DN139_c1_g2_i2:257-709(+)
MGVIIPILPLYQLTTTTAFNASNALNNILIFLVWWGSHSILARSSFKRLVGLEHHPLDRPLFAIVAPFAWFISFHFWKPVSNCEAWDITNVSIPVLLVSGTVFTLGTFQVLALLYMLPDHVFGTQKHKYPPGHQLPPPKLITDFPYSIGT